MHAKALRTATLTMLRVPMVDLYHPAQRHDSAYPNIATRYRGLLGVNYEACTGCKKCERICPNNTIIMETRVIDGKEFRFPAYFSIRCMFCGLCEEACDRQFSIRHTDQYEDAGFIREQLYYPPERMWQMFNKHIQPKIDAGMTHKATPDKKKESLPKDAVPQVPKDIPGYLEAKAEEERKKAERKAKRAK